MESDLATKHEHRSYSNAIWTKDVTSLTMFVSCSQVDQVSDPSPLQIEPVVQNHK